MKFAVICARVRIPLCVAGIVVLLIPLLGLPDWLSWIGFGLFGAGLALYFRVGIVRREPVAVELPVEGSWSAVNSPANRVPSHGLLAYGQAYAIDLVHEPEPGARPGFGWWPIARRPAEFPGFGQPVYAPAAGRVIRTHASERDHWSRTSVVGIFWLIAESVREVFGPSKILGNHVVIEIDDGVYAVLAHLQQRSLTVEVGEMVDAGAQVGACGNSGNSTEPHVHFQLMDHPRVLFAAGLPASFSRFRLNGRLQSGMPRTGQLVSAAFEGRPVTGSAPACE